MISSKILEVPPSDNEKKDAPHDYVTKDDSDVASAGGRRVGLFGLLAQGCGDGEIVPIIVEHFRH